MDDDSSSIDGDLEEFLRQNGIASIAIPATATKREGVPRVHGDADVEDESDQSTWENIEKYSRLESFDSIKLSLPSVFKVTQLLSDNGYEFMGMTAGDIDTSKRVSVYVVDEWATSVLRCVEEMTVRLDSHHTAVQNVALTSRRVEVSHEALETRVQVLQEKLLDAERKQKSSESKVLRLEEELTRSSKSKKSEGGDAKRALRGLQEKVEESERRVRQRDLEIERLKERLRQVVEKEKETNTRHREALTNISRSSADASFVSSSSSYSSASSPPSRQNASSRAGASRGSTQGRGGAGRSSVSSSSVVGATTLLPIPPVVHDMIQALEAQRDGLEQRNSELEAQLLDLQGALRDQQNGDESFGAGKGTKGGNAVLAPTGSDSCSASESSSSEPTWASETARSMYDKIKEQSRKIEQLNKKCELFKSETYEAVHVQQQLKSRCDELREEVENLRLELEARPSARQWADKQRELQDAENKLHDLVMMRGEAAELAAWRKHLSTSDRIKVDKRNHELGLWLIDSLPKAVTKEVLQTVCRELDVTDVSEIQPSIAKLKAVVKAVPRMERFITQVCEYLFERDRQIRELGGRGLAGRDRPTMEDVMPVLQSWWLDLQSNFNLVTFQTKVLTEIRRRERILAQEQGSVLVIDDEAIPQQHQAERDRAALKALETIRDMVDFQMEVFKNKKSFRAAEEFIRDQPEQMVNRQVAHLQYLFGIQHLDGLIPRMNQVYLFSEEMRNFLTSSKLSLGLVPTTSDAIAINEIQRVISVWEAEMKT